MKNRKTQPRNDQRAAGRVCRPRPVRLQRAPQTVYLWAASPWAVYLQMGLCRRSIPRVVCLDSLFPEVVLILTPRLCTQRYLAREWNRVRVFLVGVLDR